MPLHDHFHSPVNDTHSWDEVHGQWPAELVRHLMTILPPGYRAGPKVHLGSPSEVDIATYDQDSVATAGRTGGGGGGTATLTAVSSTLTIEADLTEQDEYEVRVYDTERGRTLVAAIEIVSPSNKDRRANREVFVGKVAALPCIVCESREGSEVHEPEQGLWFASMPLCAACHRGPDGWHGTRLRWRLRKVGELDAINATIGAIYGDAR